MTELIKNITSLEIAVIDVADRLRPTSDATVAALEFVIAEFGFTVPVLVRKARSGYRLIDGAHRLEAMKRLGHASIPVVAVDCTDDEARVLEGSQNLAGAAMSPLDDAIFVAAFGDAYQALHPETKRGLAGAVGKHGLATELSSFADVIAEKRAISPRQIRKIAAAGRMISKADADKLRAAKRKITLKDIEDLGKAAFPDERDFVIAEMVAGRKAGAAFTAWKAKKSGAQAVVKDPVEEAFKAMVSAWSRAPMAAKRRFMHEFGGELAMLEGDGA